MLNPILWMASAVRSYRNRGPPLWHLAHKKDQGTTGGNPYVDPLAARNRKTVPIHSVFSLISQVNSRRQPGELKRSIENGKESKITSPAAWFCLALEPEVDLTHPA